MRRTLAALVALCLILAPAAFAESDRSDIEGNIVRMTQDWPTYYDPAVGSSSSCSIVQVNVYDALVFPQYDGTVAPHVATDWTVSEDGLTYTFTIRDDIKFHSGNTLKASDVAYSMNRMIAIGEGYSYLFTDKVVSASAPDDTHVVFVLNQPFGPFILSLVRLLVVEQAEVEAHYDTAATTYGDKGDYGKTWMLTHDAGSGPYKTYEFQLDEYFMGERFDDYFLGFEEGAPKYFKISNMTDGVAVQTAMANNELEISDDLQTMESYAVMEDFPGVDCISISNGTVFNMTMNTKARFTDDVHVRRAIAWCFDYQTLVDYIYPGVAISHGPISSVLPGCDATIPAYYQDLNKAQEELALSAYAGQKITLNMTWCAEADWEEKIALLLQANLAQIGIDLEITNKPFASMITDAQTPETTPNISFIGFTASYFEAGGTLKMRYHSSSAGTWQAMEWLQDEKLDGMIDEALSTIDTVERFAKYSEIQHYLYDLCPSVWAFDFLGYRAVHTDRLDWPAVSAKINNSPYYMPLGYAVYVRNMKLLPA